MTLTEFIEQAGITAEFANKHRFRDGRANWTVTLVLIRDGQRKELVTPYSGPDTAETVRDVMETLHTDVTAYEQSPSLRAWREEWGNTHAYRGAQLEAGMLRTWFSAEQYEQFVAADLND